MASGGGSLRAYVLARLLLAVPMLLILLTVTFLLLRVAPGDPVTATLGDRVSDARADQIRHDLGLDRPAVAAVHVVPGRRRPGRLRAGHHHQPAPAHDHRRPLPGHPRADAGGHGRGRSAWACWSARLAARFRDTPLDVGGRLLGIVLYAAPIFWLGIMLQLLFSIRLGWLPTGGRIAALPGAASRSPACTWSTPSSPANWAALGSALRYLTLPAVTLGLVIGGIFIRLVRVNMLQTLKSDYVEAARARGIGERRVLFNHAFRNALVPVVTIVGLQFALLLSGAVLTEATFTWPGHRAVALPVPPEPGLHRGAGPGDVLRPVRGGREPRSSTSSRRGSIPGSGSSEPRDGRAGVERLAAAVAVDAPDRPPADGGGRRDHRRVPGHGPARARSWRPTARPSTGACRSWAGPAPTTGSARPTCATTCSPGSSSAPAWPSRW